MPPGGTVSMFVFVASCRNQMLCSFLTPRVYARYLPSGEIATRLLWPVPVSFSSLSGNGARALGAMVLFPFGFLLDPFNISQKTNPPAARTAASTAANAMDLLLARVKGASALGAAG